MGLGLWDSAFSGFLSMGCCFVFFGGSHRFSAYVHFHGMAVGSVLPGGQLQQEQVARVASSIVLAGICKRHPSSFQNNP